MRTWLLPVVGMLLTGSLIPVHAHAAKGAGLSASQEQALLGIGRSHPAAAIAMLFIDISTPPGSSGVVYLEGLPSLKGLEALLDSEGDDSRDADIVFPRSPYSTADYFVEVSWTLSSASGGGVRVSTRTQLVRSDGEPLRPVHTLESPVTILVGQDTFSILPRPAESLAGI